ncbi:MAG: FtsX-like permease family protein, partial [Clostridia bacterium]|nr:FtsX-like permease family protein [Clostridia bacterium]
SAAFMSSDPEAASMYSQMGEVESAAAFDNYLLTAEPSALLYLYDTYISSGTYEDNLKAFGVISKEAPSSISIYADSFEDKDMIADCIEAYNETASENDEIAYTDYVGLLMSSVTTIIDVISYVLIAFVSVSLVVSSIMIGIITYISVLERTKEIGILRAIGASKKNVSQVFNAETFIVGLCSGIIGIGITVLLILPINAIIHTLSGISTINAILPWKGAIFLVVLSMILTVISGLIPSRKAAKKDPVAALRSE